VQDTEQFSRRFAEIALLELEESVCPEGTKIDYRSNSDELEVLLISKITRSQILIRKI